MTRQHNLTKGSGVIVVAGYCAMVLGLILPVTQKGRADSTQTQSYRFESANVLKHETYGTGMELRIRANRRPTVSTRDLARELKKLCDLHGSKRLPDLLKQTQDVDPHYVAVRIVWNNAAISSKFNALGVKAGAYAIAFFNIKSAACGSNMVTR